MSTVMKVFVDYLVTFFIMSGWYIATSFCNICSKLALQAADKPTVAIDGSPLSSTSAYTSLVVVFILSWIQLFCGVVFGAIAASKINIGQLLNLKSNISYISTAHKGDKFMTGVCHTIGCCSLNTCYVFSSVFIVQALKSCEPLATLSLSVVILKENPSFSLVCSVLTIVSGVVAICFKDSTFSLVPCIMATISNFALPFRNVMSKKFMNADTKETPSLNCSSLNGGNNNIVAVSGKPERELESLEPLVKGDSGEELSPTREKSALSNSDNDKSAADKQAGVKVSKAQAASESFFYISLNGIIFFSPFVTVVSTVFHTELMRILLLNECLYFLLLAGSLHAMYNMCSFMFLSRVSSPTTHAIANAFKRVFTIGSAVIFFESNPGSTGLSPLAQFGLFISSMGLIWYSLITAKKKK